MDGLRRRLAIDRHPTGAHANETPQRVAGLSNGKIWRTAAKRREGNAAPASEGNSGKPHEL